MRYCIIKLIFLSNDDTPEGARTVAGALGGALIGWAVGGPVGAFVGLLLGGAIGGSADAEDANKKRLRRGARR